MPGHTAPGLELSIGYTVGEDGWGPAYNSDLRKLSVLAQPVVFSRVSELPDTPTQGDRHILLAEDSNSGAEDSIIAYDDGAWFYLTPLEGWEVWSIADSAKYRFVGGAWVEIEAATPSAGGIPYDAGTDGDSNSTDATVQDALDELFRRSRAFPHPATYVVGAGTDESREFTYVFTEAVRYDDLTACKAYAGVPIVGDSNSAEITINILHNGVLFATLAFDDGATAGVFTAVGDSNSGDEVWDINDRMTFVMPASFSGLTKISITMHGQRVG